MYMSHAYVDMLDPNLTNIGQNVTKTALVIITQDIGQT